MSTTMAPKRITPEGQEVAPGALAQGYPVTLPDLRIEAVYVTVEPDTFQGRILAKGTQVAATEITDTEPEAIIAAEELLVDAMARLFALPRA